jgi:hypothetical protein
MGIYLQVSIAYIPLALCFASLGGTSAVLNEAKHHAGGSIWQHTMYCSIYEITQCQNQICIFQNGLLKAMCFLAKKIRQLISDFIPLLKSFVCWLGHKFVKS